jgi:recombination protein RecT
MSNTTTRPGRDNVRGSAPAGSVRGEVAKRETDYQSVVVARQYQAKFAEVLPEHIAAPAFVGAAIGALRKDPDLLQAAENSPAALVVAMMHCASLGHVPGGKDYYLTPRWNGKTKRLEIVGMEGYQGVIERMYRSGAVAAVKVREVCVGDKFRFVEGEMSRPVHEVDWFADDDRHSPDAIIGVYAYAELTTGATSRVVVLNRRDIERAKQQSDLGKQDKGPWRDNYRAMVLKTGAHRLEPWVPTSAEYRREQLRAEAAAAEAVPEAPAAGGSVDQAPAGPPPGVDPGTGEVTGDDGVIDGVVVSDTAVNQ